MAGFVLAAGLESGTLCFAPARGRQCRAVDTRWMIKWRNPRGQMAFLVKTILLTGLVPYACSGQSDIGKPEFEVASIKPAGPADAGMQASYDPGRLTVRGASLKSLIELAYRVKDQQVSGGPNWMDSARYDIEAKLPKGAAAGSHRRMLQTLLTDRFQLRLRTEARVVAGLCSRRGQEWTEAAGDRTRARIRHCGAESNRRQGYVHGRTCRCLVQRASPPRRRQDRHPGSLRYRGLVVARRTRAVDTQAWDHGSL